MKTNQFHDEDNRNILFEKYTRYPDTEEKEVLDEQNPYMNEKKAKTKENSWKDIELFPLPSNKSNVWQFGGFRKDDHGKLLRSHVMCGVCGIQIKYLNNISNFKNHLKKQHPVEYSESFDDMERNTFLIKDDPSKFYEKENKATKPIVCEEKQYTLQYEHKDYTDEENAIKIGNWVVSP